VIAKLDRLPRDAAFLLNLQKAGVRFAAADMPEPNELVVGIMAVVAHPSSTGWGMDGYPGATGESFLSRRRSSHPSANAVIDRLNGEAILYRRLRRNKNSKMMMGIGIPISQSRPPVSIAVS
jgi:hypothetical protein